MHHYTHHISSFVQHLTLFFKENGLFSVKFKEIMKRFKEIMIQKLLQMTIEISAHKKIENALNNVEIIFLKSDSYLWRLKIL